jgi:hypothetical protein
LPVRANQAKQPQIVLANWGILGGHDWGIFKWPSGGDPLFALGHPLGLPLKVAPNGQYIRLGGKFLEHDLDLFGGNSGCPVFNERNQVVGINSAGPEDWETDAENDCNRAAIIGPSGLRSGAFWVGQQDFQQALQQALKEALNEARGEVAGPSPAGSGAFSEASSEASYTVQQGDTLYFIARLCLGLSRDQAKSNSSLTEAQRAQVGQFVTALRGANPSIGEGSNLKIGQNLTLPEGCRITAQ